MQDRRSQLSCAFSLSSFDGTSNSSPNSHLKEVCNTVELRCSPCGQASLRAGLSGDIQELLLDAVSGPEGDSSVRRNFRQVVIEAKKRSACLHDELLLLRCEWNTQECLKLADTRLQRYPTVSSVSLAAVPAGRRPAARAWEMMSINFCWIRSRAQKVTLPWEGISEKSWSKQSEECSAMLHQELVVDQNRSDPRQSTLSVIIASSK